jgi:hypothetical protein
MAMKPEVRERIRAEMTPLIEAWRASGESRRVFAGRHEMSLSKFDYWVRQLAPMRPPSRRETPPGFAAVDLVLPRVPGGIEIVLARGDRVVVRAEADVSLVRAVLAALRARC